MFALLELHYVAGYVQSSAILRTKAKCVLAEGETHSHRNGDKTFHILMTLADFLIVNISSTTTGRF